MQLEAMKNETRKEKKQRRRKIYKDDEIRDKIMKKEKKSVCTWKKHFLK